ncbi:dihydrofolate reductase family protein [Streptomyces sp. HNM0574]|uniref:dihydrofolate reductase family protein n=1 Tax=Streptomyces sp. HNM0574 TaxID=2714954 RepID=UPI00146DADDD|nr:dihydrofolate reductase family protein [Streptomyces sp. HNM0574]NLU65886.1 dihydrofolate reductase family protein [Streptomyces sp. HNM0574]
MRDLIVTENITLDGVIDAEGGWFGPAGEGTADGADQSDVEAELRRQRQTADAFLTGRATFEAMRGYWPRRTDDTTGISEYLDNVSKYVVSRTLQDPEWQHTTVLRGPLEDEIRGLKSAAGKDIVTTGSIRLVHGLIEAGLVDEYRLFVHPVHLGRGRRLFTDVGETRKLHLAEARPFTSGIVLLRYRTR